MPQSQLREPYHDVTTIPASFAKTNIDLHINTSPCKSFSRLQDSPLGFRDKVNTRPAIAAAKLHAQLQHTNPKIRKLVENVQFHPALVEDAVKFQRMWSDVAVPLNAMSYGSPSSRPRTYMTDIVDLRTLPEVPCLSLNDVK